MAFFLPCFVDIFVAFDLQLCAPVVLTFLYLYVRILIKYVVGLLESMA